MLTPSKLTTIKWAGPNTVMIEVERNSARLYLDKPEAVDLIEAVKMFIDAYPDDFKPENINNIDKIDDNWDDWTWTQA